MRIARYASLGFLLILLCASCAQAAPLVLEGTAWELAELDGMPLMDETAITIAFDDQMARGHSGCNSYFGSYAVLGASGIQFTDIGMTEMFCLDPEGLMDQESRYLGLLRDATGVVMQDGRLALQDASGNDILVYFSSTQ